MEEQKEQPKAKAKAKVSRNWSRGLTIHNFGRVERDDLASEEAIKALREAGVNPEVYLK